MSLWADVRIIQTGTGTAALSAVTGLPSTPKALMFMGVGLTSAGTGSLFDPGFGVATATGERWCIAGQSRNNQATTDCNRVMRTDACFTLLKFDHTDGGRLDINAINSDGYQLIPDVAFAQDTAVIVIALGGTDITNAKAYTFTAATATGNQSDTTAGFQPSVNLFGTMANTTLGTVAVHHSWNVGWAVDSSHQGMTGQGASDNVVTATNPRARSIITTTRCLGIVSTSADSMQSEWTFVSNDATGITLNRNTGTSADTIGVLSLAGLQAAAFSTTMRTDTNDQPVTGLGIGTPLLVLLLGRPNVTASQSSTPTANLEVMMGAASGASARAAVWSGDLNNRATATLTSKALSTTRCVINYDVTDGTTLEGDMDFKTFDSDGLTLDEITADTAGAFLLGLAFAPAAAGAGQPATKRMGAVPYARGDNGPYSPRRW